MGDPKKTRAVEAESIIADLTDLEEPTPPMGVPQIITDFDAPLSAPGPVMAQRLTVTAPALLLVVDDEIRRGLQTAVRLMEHGYTCRVVRFDEAQKALHVQSFEVIWMEFDLGKARQGAQEVLGSIADLPSVRIISSPTEMSSGSLAHVLLKPWLTEAAVQTIENARQKRVRPLGTTPKTRGKTREPETWEVLSEKAVRARIGSPSASGYSPARIRKASYEGTLDLEAQANALLDGVMYDVHLSLSDGRASVFQGRAHKNAQSWWVKLSFESAEMPIFLRWLEESADTEVPRSEPVRLVPHELASRGPSSALSHLGTEGRSERTAGRNEPNRSVSSLWQKAAQDLDDDGLQQHFIQTCVRAKQLEFAVRCYRGLKEASPDDPRPQKYLQQVGTIIGFYALKQDQVSLGEDEGLSSTIRFALGTFILAAVILFVLSQTLS